MALASEPRRGKLKRVNMADEKQSTPPPVVGQAAPAPATPGTAWRWPLVIVLLALFALIAFIVSLRATKQVYDETLDRAGRGFHKAAATARDIAARFQRGIITETFTAAIPQLQGTGMGNLELATAEATETFTKADAKTIAWDLLYLGTTETEIKVPVTYRYHLRLADAWRLDVSNQTCIVYAPMVRPSLPPAIHTDRMEKKSERGWARLNAGQQMAELESSITPTLRRYAGDPRHLRMVREECRKTVAEFVKNWLLQEDHWRQDRFHTIKVIFADEAGVDVSQVGPTIRLKE